MALPVASPTVTNGDSTLATTDEAALAAVARGEEAALALLYDRYAAAVCALVARIVGDEALAEEATQEVFLRVWLRAGGYDPARGRAASWLLSLAHHLAIDLLRRRRAAVGRLPETDEGESLLGLLPDPVADVESEVWATEQRRLLQSALRRLPAQQREVIAHAYYGGLSQSQIAARLGLPLGTVKSRIGQALRRLRGLVEPQGLTAAALPDRAERPAALGLSSHARSAA